MKTVNISLTTEQDKLVDHLISRYGFANRSEFFRSLLRLIRNQPDIVLKADGLTFFPPNTRDPRKILYSYKKSGRYSKDFLKDLELGLNESDYFTKK